MRLSGIRSDTVGLLVEHVFKILTKLVHLFCLQIQEINLIDITFDIIDVTIVLRIAPLGLLVDPDDALLFRMSTKFAFFD